MMKQTGAREFKTSRYDGNIRELPLYQRYLQREFKALSGAFLIGTDQYPPYLSNDIWHKIRNNTPLNTAEAKELREHRAECAGRQTIAEKGIALIRNSSTDDVYEKFAQVERDDRYNSIDKCKFMLQILDNTFRGSQRQQNLVIETIKKEADQFCKPANTPQEAEVRLGCLKSKEQELITFAGGAARLSWQEIERKVITILDETQFISTVMRINQQGFQDVADVLKIFKEEMASVRGYSEGKTAREHMLHETTAPFSIQSSPTTAASSQSSASSSPIVAAAMTQSNDEIRRECDDLRRDLEKLKRDRAQSPSRSDNSGPRDGRDRRWTPRDERDRNGRSPSRERRDDRRSTPHWTEDRSRRSPSRDSYQQFQQWQQWQQFHDTHQRGGQDRRPPPPGRSGSPHPRREDGERPQQFYSRR